MIKTNTSTPASNTPDVDYHMVAMAMAIVRKRERLNPSVDAVVAAYRRLSRCRWLGQIINPRTGNAVRPWQPTPAEHAVLLAKSEADLSGDYPEDEQEVLHAETDHLQRTRVEPETEPAPTTVEKDWFERTMTEFHIRTWLAVRAKDEIETRKIGEEADRCQKLFDNEQGHTIH